MHFRSTTAGFKTNSPSLPTISITDALDDLLGEVVRNIVPTQLPLPTTIMMSGSDPYELRAKYTHFRILVIGRANAGKTTLLQRVCNTTEDPCIYDDDKNLVCKEI